MDKAGTAGVVIYENATHIGIGFMDGNIYMYEKD